MKNGIPSESSYPYTGKDDNCKPFPPSFKITSFVNVPANDF